jgi:hypothetical protein
MSSDVEPIDGHGTRGRSTPFVYEEDSFEPHFRSLFPDPYYYGDLSSTEEANSKVQVATPPDMFDSLSVESRWPPPMLHDQWNLSSTSVPSVSESETSDENNYRQELSYTSFRDPHGRVHPRDSRPYQLRPNYGNQPARDASWIPHQEPFVYNYPYNPHHSQLRENALYTHVYHERQFSPYSNGGHPSFQNGGQPSFHIQDQQRFPNMGFRAPTYRTSSKQKVHHQDAPSVVDLPARLLLPSNSLNSRGNEDTQSLASNFRVQKGPKMVEISPGFQVPLRGAEEVRTVFPAVFRRTLLDFLIFCFSI